jgi:hypothetical protein
MYQEYFKKAAIESCSGCIGTHCEFKKQQSGKEKKKRDEKGEKEKAIACVALELLRTLRIKLTGVLEYPPLLIVGKVRDRAIKMPFFQE